MRALRGGLSPPLFLGFQMYQKSLKSAKYMCALKMSL